MDTGQLGGNNLLTEVPSSKVTLAYIKLTKTNQNTLDIYLQNNEIRSLVLSMHETQYQMDQEPQHNIC